MPAGPGALPGAWPPAQGLPTGSGLVEPTPQAQSRTADVRALGDAKTGALYGIIGLILSVIGTLVSFTYGGLGLGSGITCNSVTDTCTTSSNGIGLLGGLFAVEVIGYIIAILFIWKFRAAFQTLVPYDYRFRSPASLSILAIVGIAILIIGFGLLVGAAASILGSCGSTASYTSCDNAITSAAGLLFGGLGLIVLGGILLLIGGIMILIGIWRLGTRYNESLLKVGAILLIIPVLNIVAPFLIYFGASQAERRLGAGAAMAGVGPTAFPPPGVR
jgi:hypothetical protein